MIYGEDAILVKELKKVNSAIYDNHSDEEKSFDRFRCEKSN